jgi:hypothetical protein
MLEGEVSRMSTFRSSSLFENKARRATQIGTVFYVVASFAFLELGQVNGDEGWYLYGSKLAFLGELPYRDFSFTQMPLFLYIYGIFQVIHPSLLLGRLTSIFISLSTLGMGIAVARRYAGARAGAIAALLFAAFTFGIYFNTIVKTYALVSFFLIATLWVLSSQLKETIKYPLAMLFALATALVRIAAVVFVVPVLLYAFFATPRLRTRLLILAESVAASLGAGFFLLPDWTAARWNLFDSHLEHWGDASLFAQINQLLAERLPDIVQNFGPVLMLSIAAGYALWRIPKLRAWQRHPAPLYVVTLGLVLFAAVHLVNGLWVTEYMVPAVVAFLPILAILLSQVYAGLEKQSQVFFQGTLLTALFLLMLTESIAHIDVTGRQLPLAEEDQAATFVAQHSQPTDPVLVLEALPVVLDADRSVVPGMTLAQFSLQSLDAATARQLHVVNPEMVLDMVNQSTAKIVIITDGDWDRLSGMDPVRANALRNALAQQYHLGLTVPRFGQFARNAFIYLSD